MHRHPTSKLAYVTNENSPPKKVSKKSAWWAFSSQLSLASQHMGCLLHLASYWSSSGADTIMWVYNLTTTHCNPNFSRSYSCCPFSHFMSFRPTCYCRHRTSCSASRRNPNLVLVLRRQCAFVQFSVMTVEYSLHDSFHFFRGC